MRPTLLVLFALSTSWIVGCPKSEPSAGPASSTSGSAMASASASAGPPHEYKDFTDAELQHAMDLDRSISLVQVKAVTAEVDAGTKASGARYDFQLIDKLYGSPTSIALEHSGTPVRLVQDRYYIVFVERVFKELVDYAEVPAEKFKDVGHDYEARIAKLEAAGEASASASASASVAPSSSASTKPSSSAKPAVSGAKK